MKKKIIEFISMLILVGVSFQPAFVQGQEKKSFDVDSINSDSLISIETTGVGLDQYGTKREQDNPSALPKQTFTQYNLYAPPSLWSSWYKIGTHAGPVTYSVKLEPIGDTMVKGRVRYFDANNKQVVREFIDKAVFRTGNSWAHVELSMKGIPLGTAVKVTVSP